ALGEDALAGRTVLDLDLDHASPPWHLHPDTDPAPRGLTSRHLAYVIYTSGSTGTPKGTMVEHRSAVNFWQCMTQTTHQSCKPRSRIALNSSFSFDMSMKGILQLLSGHTLIIVPQEMRGDGTAFLDYLGSQRADAFETTPSQMQVLLDAGFLESTNGRAMNVLLGGEAIGQTMWDVLRGSSVDFYNMYGPTECTVDATIGLIRDLGNQPSIGKPIGNMRVYLLDAHRQPVPLGAIGELYIGGAGVARGYLNRPDLTAERFLADPFAGDPDARMYRTGDLARYRPDGNLVFLGRNDHQVKLRGFRIELGEIQARLSRHDEVRDTVVLAVDAEANMRLVAYVVPSVGSEREGLPARLRAHLANDLPDYMIPAGYVLLDSLPQTPGGKLDRKALPAPQANAFASHAYEAPEGEVEAALADIWRDLLKVDRVGRHDDFFELGGHSLLAIQLVNRIQGELDVRIELSVLFRHRTLSSLAKSVLISLLSQEFDASDLRELSAPDEAVS
ncbi:MAG: amino acid adenylation domain-containing protein, partial [Luteibacter sp.]